METTVNNSLNCLPDSPELLDATPSTQLFSIHQVQVLLKQQRATILQHISDRYAASADAPFAVQNPDFWSSVPYDSSSVFMPWPVSSQPADATAQQTFDPFRYNDGYDATFAVIDNYDPIIYQPTPVYASTGFQYANDAMNTGPTAVFDNRPLRHNWTYLPGHAGTSFPSSDSDVPALSPSELWSRNSNIDSALNSSSSFLGTFNQLESCNNLSEAVAAPYSSKFDEKIHYMSIEDSMSIQPSSPDLDYVKLDRNSTSSNTRNHPWYKARPDPDGFHRCPFNNGCNHKPEKLKCNYDKQLDSHIKPYQCKRFKCVGVSFSSTACLLRHEREAHGLHGHGEKPWPCKFRDCDRSHPGEGFSRRNNLMDHMRRTHDYPPQGAVSNESIVLSSGRKRTQGRSRRLQ